MIGTCCPEVAALVAGLLNLSADAACTGRPALGGGLLREVPPLGRCIHWPGEHSPVSREEIGFRRSAAITMTTRNIKL